MLDGYISKIQRYSTKDGPGVRSTVFALGCNLKCLWCANPELIGDTTKILHHPNRCVRCGSCVARSDGGITLTEDGIKIDRNAVDLEKVSAFCYYDAYEKVGIKISSKNLATQLLRDKAFFDQSGGGVTFSGGEAGLQANFFREVTAHLKKSNAHVALDTAGHLPWSRLAPLVHDVDLVLYDLKTLSSSLHKCYTDVDNHLILENAVKIADTGKPMIIRMILIPGVNDSEDEILGRLKFVKQLGANDTSTQVDFLKYHKLGGGKYASLGMADAMADTEECSDSLAEYALNLALNMGISATIGG